MKNAIFGIIVIIFSIILAFLAAEIFLRVTNKSPVKSTWLEMHNRGFMMNRASIDALYTLDDRSVRKSISEMRTRGSAPDTNDLNIFVMGDSFTFGLLLEEQDTFVELLNERVESEAPDSGVRFINAGVGGTGLADWVAQLDEFRDVWPMDGILIVHNYDDFLRMLAKNLYVAQPDSTLLHSMRWVENPIKRSFDRSSVWKSLQENSRLASLLQNYLWSSFYFSDIIYGPDSDPELPRMPEYEWEHEYAEYAITLTSKLYERLAELADELDIPLWVGTTGYLYDDNLTDINREVISELGEILEKQGIPYKDITPALSEKVDGDFARITIPRDTHPNEEGSAMVAELLWEQLLRDLIFKSSL